MAPFTPEEYEAIIASFGPDREHSAHMNDLVVGIFTSAFSGKQLAIAENIAVAFVNASRPIPP
jgi:hypothetical protein